MVKMRKQKLQPERKSESTAINVNATKKLFRFFADYSLKSPVLWSGVGIIFITFLVSNSILITNENYLSYSLLLIAPYFIQSIFVNFFLSWKLFVSTNSDGTSLFVFSKKNSRVNVWIAKWLVNLATVTVVLLVQMVISLIFNLASGFSVSDAFVFSLLVFIAAIFVACFLIAIAQLIATLFQEIVALVSLVVLGLVFGAAPFVTNQVTQVEKNALTWDLSQNTKNYAKLLQINNEGVVTTSETVVYDSGLKAKNKSNENSNNVSTNAGFGVFLNKIVTTPFESFVSQQIKLNSLRSSNLSKDAKWTVLNLTDQIKADATYLDNQSRYLPYGIDDVNPVESSYGSLLEYWKKTLQNWDATRFIDINNQTQMKQLLERLTRDVYWSSTNLNIGEKTLIKKLIGFNKEDAQIFYLFRDWTSLSAKYNNIFTNLKGYNFPADAIDLIAYLFTGENVRDNIFKRFALMTQNEIETLFPMLLTYEDAEAATYYDLEQMKDLVVSIDAENKNAVIFTNNNAQPTMQISINNISDFIWTSKAEWNSKITQFPQLGSLKNMYSAVKKAAENNSVQVKSIVFNKNATDAYQFEKVITLKIEPDFTPLIVIWLFLVSITALAVIGGYYLDKMKDIK